jgi:hypothetical protein
VATSRSVQTRSAAGASHCWARLRAPAPGLGRTKKRGRDETGEREKARRNGRFNGNQRQQLLRGEGSPTDVPRQHSKVGLLFRLIVGCQNQFVERALGAAEDTIVRPVRRPSSKETSGITALVKHSRSDAALLPGLVSVSAPSRQRAALHRRRPQRTLRQSEQVVGG